MDHGGPPSCVILILLINAKYADHKSHHHHHHRHHHLNVLRREAIGAKAHILLILTAYASIFLWCPYYPFYSSISSLAPGHIPLFPPLGHSIFLSRLFMIDQVLSFYFYLICFLWASLGPFLCQPKHIAHAYPLPSPLPPFLPPCTHLPESISFSKAFSFSPGSYPIYFLFHGTQVIMQRIVSIHRSYLLRFLISCNTIVGTPLNSSFLRPSFIDNFSK